MPVTRRSARSPEECDHLLGEYLAAGDLDAILQRRRKQHGGDEDSRRRHIALLVG